MKPGQIVKMTVDLVMTVLLLLLMAWHLTGQAAHEWLGAGMLLLFLLHNALNHRWYGGLFRGRYPPFRILQTAVNLLVLLSMLCQMASGIILSRHVFGFLSISGYASLGRLMHLLGAYWGFALMSIHLGLHWGMVMGMARRAVGFSAPSRTRTVLCRVLAVLVALYGAAAFVRYNLLSYMLLKNQFVFFDFEQSALSFFTDYLAMMGLWIFLAHYAGKLARLSGRG